LDLGPRSDNFSQKSLNQPLVMTLPTKKTYIQKFPNFSMQSAVLSASLQRSINQSACEKWPNVLALFCAEIVAHPGL